MFKRSYVSNTPQRKSGPIKIRQNCSGKPVEFLICLAVWVVGLVAVASIAIGVYNKSIEIKNDVETAQRAEQLEYDDWLKIVESEVD